MDQHDPFLSSSDGLRVETGSNGLDPTVERPLLTPGALKAKRESAARGFLFKLRRTSLEVGQDVYANVKPLDLTDHVVIGSLPSAMQSRVMRAMMAISKTTPALNEKTNTLSVPVAIRNLEKNEDLVNAYCVAGFIDPPLIWVETDRVNTSQVVVTDIALTDRREFFALCGNSAEDEADRLLPFPARSVPGVETRPAGDALRPTPVPVAEPERMPE